MTLGGSFEWAPRIAKRTKWKTGAQIYRAQYGKSAFNDMTVTLASGPQVTLKRWDFNLAGIVSRRWYGDRGYSNSYGGSANVTYFINPRLGVGANLLVREFDYDLNKQQDGLGVNVGASFFYAPTSSSFVRGNVTLGHQDARIPGFAFDSVQVGLSYTRDFAGGLTAGVSPSYTEIKYDAALAAFGVARHDRQYAVQVSLLNRRWDFYGFTPRVAYTFIKNDSNLAFYTFKRNRFEIGLTSSF
ncbi:MAG: surface lipoprotein assembly modifier [Novosphingobium sp.]|nr:surface lipoprotein assembly modifier [Novosphingobium sp.]